MNLDKYTKHLREREYMSGVERDKSRVKSTGEVFTPTPLVQEILNQLPIEQFTDPTKTFIDPSCGDGQFLSEVILKKMENGSTYQQAVDTTYGVDLMLDNCLECIRRLYGAEQTPVIKTIEGDDIPKAWRREGLKSIFEVNGTIANIVNADGLLYDYSFGKVQIETLGDSDLIQYG